MRLFALAMLLVVSAAPADAQRRSRATAPAPPPSLTIEAINEAPRPELGDLAARRPGRPPPPNPSILRLQVLLDRAHAAPGVIDGHDGDNLRRAIAAYREMRGLPEGDRVDEAMWTQLTENAAPVLTRYTITNRDVRGPFEPRLSSDFADLARLRRIPYRRASEMLAERFHMDEELLRALNSRARFDSGDELVVADPGPPLQLRARAGRLLIARGALRVLGADGALLAHYPATIGSDQTPSPEGEHRVRRIARNPVYVYNPEINFQQGNNRRRLTLPPGPNNPVGTVWIALSEPTYGIHGTPDPANIGYRSSHGCVRLTNWDAEELAGLAHVGLVVQFQSEGSQQGAPTPPEHPLRQRAETTAPAPPPRPDVPAAGDAPRPEPTPPAVRPPPDPPAPLTDEAQATCLDALREIGAVFEAHAPIAEAHCSAARPIRVTRLGNGVTLSAPIVTLCPAAVAFAQWVRDDVQPAAMRELGAPLTGLVVGGSYECRNRNRATAGPISEHAFANAIDVMGFALRGRRTVSVGPAGPEPDGEDRFLAAARAAACHRFTTVIGPGTDEAHANHFHLDLRERRGGFRLCQ